VYLLDTDVLSLTSPRRRLPDETLERWHAFVRDNMGDLHLSAVSLMEVRYGVEAQRARGATRQAAELEKWLLIAETIYAERLLPVSSTVAHRAGSMLARASAAGFAPGAEDALIAATAVEHGLQILSRNRRDMEALGADCLDPLANLPR
jgi:predicted nucleic acid-binding protein